MNAFAFTPKRTTIYQFPLRVRSTSVKPSTKKGNAVIAAIALFLMLSLWQTVQIGRLAAETKRLGSDIEVLAVERNAIIDEYEQYGIRVDDTAFPNDGV